MPSTQTPPLQGLATDPTSLRGPIDDATIERIEPSALRERLLSAKAEGYTMLLDIGAVDYPERSPRFDVVYHLLKLSPDATSVAATGTPSRLRILCALDEATHLPTASDVWPSADWAEREIWDLFGLTFDGHPDLRRIQMPNDWEGHPLRKDYPLRGPALENSPRPAFALKSNVQAGTPPTGRTLEALQEQVKREKQK